MRLQKLTALEQDKIDHEYRDILDQIREFRRILSSTEAQKDIIKKELDVLDERYGDTRRTKVVYSADEFNIEDMIADEDVVVTISNNGFIKRTPVSGFRRQKRGGTGMRGATTKEEEYVEHLFVATNHNYILFFTERGSCYWLKVYEIPEGSRLSRGRAIVNLIELEKGDSIKTFVPVKTLTDEKYVQQHNIIMATKKGVVKKSMLEDYSRPRRNGIIAIKVDEDDELLGAALTNGNSTILLGARNGRAIRFLETDVRAMGRNTRGVRGINLNQDENDEVVDMVVVQNTNEATVLAISEHGYGKRSLVEDYREQSRGGKGVITLKRTEKTGDLVGLKEVSDVDDLMIITHKGKIIRMHCSDIRSMGRNTQGVRIMRLGNGDQISGVTRVVREEEAEEKAEDAIAKAEGEEGSTPPDTQGNPEQQDSPDTGTDAADETEEDDDTDPKD
jgi:DNA gyrase subunit A